MTLQLNISVVWITLSQLHLVQNHICSNPSLHFKGISHHIAITGLLLWITKIKVASVQNIWTSLYTIS